MNFLGIVLMPVAIVVNSMCPLNIHDHSAAVNKNKESYKRFLSDAFGLGLGKKNKIK